MARWGVRDRNEVTSVAEVPRSGSIDAAVSLVDDALVAFARRDLVSGDEVVDRLLDLRNALIAAALLHELEVGS
jgi:hypothetical protein